jgi:hypothetical protein
MSHEVERITKDYKYWKHERKNCKNLLYKVEKGSNDINV